MEIFYENYFNFDCSTHNLHLYLQHIQCDNKKWIKILSPVDIPTNVMNILSSGPHFGFDNSSISHTDIFDIINAIEIHVYKIPNNNREFVRNDVTKIILNNISNQQKSNRHLSLSEKNFLDHLRETEKSLNEHREVMVTKADKSNCTVILDRNYYHQKTNDILTDRDTYNTITTIHVIK